MADNELSVSAAAGLDLTDTPDYSEAINPAAEVAVSRQQFNDKIAAQQEKDGYTWGATFTDIGNQTLTGMLIGNLDAPDFQNDPLFTEENFQVRFKAAQQKLPEQFWPDLEGAQSDAEFTWLEKRATDHLAATQRLQDAGWSAAVANFMAQMLDPASVALAGGVMAPAAKTAQAAKLGIAAQRGVNAASAGAGVGGTLLAYDAAGAPTPTASEYLFAAGLGMVLGGALGPLSRSPATADEAAHFIAKGEEVKAAAQRVETVEQAPAPVAGTSAVEAAAETAAKADFDPFAREVNVIVQLRTAGEDAIRAKLSTYDLDTLKLIGREQSLGGVDKSQTVEQAVDRLVHAASSRVKNLKAASQGRDTGSYKPDSDVPERPSMDADVAPTTPKVTLEDLAPMETPPEAMAKSPRFIAAYATDEGLTYRIDAMTDDMSGPYRVTMVDAKGKPKLVAKDLDTMAEAKSHLPKRQKLEEPAPAQAADDVAEEVDEIEGLMPDAETLRANIASATDALRLAGDEDTANEIQRAVDAYTAQLEPPPAAATAEAAPTVETVAARLSGLNKAQLLAVAKELNVGSRVKVMN